MLPKDILIAVGIILLWSINLLILKIFSPQIPIDFFLFRVGATLWRQGWHH